jgi:hypothetical protein
MSDGTPGHIAGISQAFCIYRLVDAETLCVANWRDIAIGNICPAPSLLPATVSENDGRNGSATVLRELLALHQVAPLTSAQKATLEELVCFLCDA